MNEKEYSDPIGTVLIGMYVVGFTFLLPLWIIGFTTRWTLRKLFKKDIVFIVD